MSNVLKRHQKDNDFTPVALSHRLRRILTYYCMRDFGTRPRIRSINWDFITDEGDKAIITELCDKYTQLEEGKLKEQYPEWLINKCRDIIIDEVNTLHINVIKANSIFPMTGTVWYEKEVIQRRLYWNAAIGCCESLLRTLDYLADIFKLNLNSFVSITEMITHEIASIRYDRKRYKLRNDCEESSNACNVNNNGNANNNTVSNVNGARADS